MDRDATVPASEDIVDTTGWLRPRLIGGRPALMVAARGCGQWESMGKKHVKEKVPGVHCSR